MFAALPNRATMDAMAAMIRVRPLALAAVPLALGLLLSAGTISGCAQLRRNLRGQELSFRGAYLCEESACDDAKLVRSRVGTTDGTTPVVTVKFIPRVALAFTAETAFESLAVTVEGCKGEVAALPPTAIRPTGDHQIGPAEARESWMVELEPRALADLGVAYGDRGPCGRLRVHVEGTWADGTKFPFDVVLTRRK